MLRDAIGHAEADAMRPHAARSRGGSAPVARRGGGGRAARMATLMHAAANSSAILRAMQDVADGAGAMLREAKASRTWPNRSKCARRSTAPGHRGPEPGHHRPLPAGAWTRACAEALSGQRIDTPGGWRHRHPAHAAAIARGRLHAFIFQPESHAMSSAVDSSSKHRNKWPSHRPLCTVLPHPDLCPDGLFFEGQAPARSWWTPCSRQGIAIEHACEKVCACATCHVHIREGAERHRHLPTTTRKTSSTTPGAWTRSRACRAASSSTAHR